MYPSVGQGINCDLLNGPTRHNFGSTFVPSRIDIAARVLIENLIQTACGDATRLCLHLFHADHLLSLHQCLESSFPRSTLDTDGESPEGLKLIEVALQNEVSNDPQEGLDRRAKRDGLERDRAGFSRTMATCSLLGRLGRYG
jgi:hypothetical protein